MDKIEMFKHEIIKLDEEIERLRMVKISLNGYIKVEEIRNLTEEFASKQEGVTDGAL